MAENDKIIPYRWSSKTDWYEPTFNATAILIEVKINGMDSLKIY